MPSLSVTKQTSAQTGSTSSTGAGSTLGTERSTGGSGASLTVGNAAAHQDSIGNSGVAAAIAVSGSGPTVDTGVVGWTPAEIVAIQTQLQKSGLYAKKLDGQLGPGSKAGLTAAFGGDHWSVLPATEVLAQLQAMGTQPTHTGASWSKAQAKAIQRELGRLGLYRSAIDGDLGKGSKAALVEAFGDDSWATMSAEDVLARLVSARPPASSEGIRYGEMFKDGLLDMTLGLGFDEGNWHNKVSPGILDAIRTRGFKEDAAGAAALYKRAGRTLGDSAFGAYFVKKAAIQWQPPAGPARSVDVVLRFVTNSASGSGKSEGEGARAAGAYLEGMQDSDVSYYAGHGRYGSGPDFDRDMRFQTLNAAGDVEKEYDDYSVLEKDLLAEGAPHAQSAWQVYQARTRAGTLKTIGVNDGNLMMNPTNGHPNEFGGNVMYDTLEKGGKKPVTGKDGALGDTEKEYRLLVFDGCRTRDYKKCLRATPNAAERDVSMINTTRVTYWGDEAATIGAFLDGVLGTEAASGLTGKMDAKQQVDTSSAFEFN